MVSKTYSVSLVGLKPFKIEVEVDGTQGLPTLVIIGLPTKAVEEAKERITTALINCGIRIRGKRTIVNLAPADIRKTSSVVELAITVGILQMYGEIPKVSADTIFLGELSLDGNLKPIRGALPLVLAAKKLGFKKVILPRANQDELSLLKGITIYPLDNLKQYLELVKKNLPLPTLNQDRKDLPKSNVSATEQETFYDFSQIIGQEEAKRACVIAAAGGHNLLLVGPPGAGKSLLAQSMVGILSPMTDEEILEVTSLHSLIGVNKLITTRPFRSPHHSVSHVGLVGGGKHLSPGEISLAHRGILFLDEFPEYNHQAREAIRQPLESRSIRITRSHGSALYPASFTLIAAANPCPCGYAGTQLDDCKCTPLAREIYQQKLSGPILDRIDLQVRVKKVATKDLAKYKSSNASTSLELRNKVIKAREKQRQRFRKTEWSSNAELSNQAVKKFINMTDKAKKLLTLATDKLNLSARGYFKVIKVSQTIADLGEASEVDEAQIAEALQYRGLG